MSKVTRIREKQKVGQLELTVQQLVNSKQALSSLVSQPLVFGTSFKLAKVVKAVNEELQTYDDLRRKLCEKYGTLTEDESQYDIPANKQKEFNAEFAELLATPIQLPGSPLRPAEFGRVEMSAGDLLALEWLIVE